MTTCTQFSLDYMNEGTKSRFEVIVTSYGRNKNPVEEMKKNKRPIIACFRFEAFNETNSTKNNENGYL